MKIVRDLSWVTAVVAVSALAAAGMTMLWLYAADYGTAITGRLIWKVVLCVAIFLGMSWLFWGWLGMKKESSYVVHKLKTENQQSSELHVNDVGENENLTKPKRENLFGSVWPVQTELTKAVEVHLQNYSRNIGPLRKQVEDLQMQLRLLQKQKQNTEAIIQSIRDAVIAVDEFDRLLTANEAAGKLLGFDYKNSEHKNIADVISPEKQQFLDFLTKGRQSKVSHKRKEIECKVAGKLRVYDCVLSCAYDASDMICGVIAVLHDITREKQISQTKNDFVSSVSHELKTPLASITAYSEMLVDGEAKDEPMRKEFYSVIQNQAERLNRLIENVLNISRIESGMAKVDKQPLSLTVLIEEQIRMIQTYAEHKNISVTRSKPIVQDQVNADKDMLSQVIINLLSNAVKYTTSGGTVNVHTEIDDQLGVVRVSITDTGVGIPQEEIEHIFDKFYRVDKSRQKARGTGLGLNLVKQIIEKVHNGRIFVKSEQGTGSTFAFELPLAKAEALT